MEPRQRGNAVQLLEKYNNLAREAQQQGERVQAEYYMQYADHYHRVVAEMRARQDDRQAQQPAQRGRDDRDQERDVRDRDDRDDDRYSRGDQHDDNRDDEDDRPQAVRREARHEGRPNRDRPNRDHDNREVRDSARAVSVPVAEPDEDEDDVHVGGALRTLARSPRAARDSNSKTVPTVPSVPPADGDAGDRAPVAAEPRRPRGRPRKLVTADGDRGPSDG